MEVGGIEAHTRVVVQGLTPYCGQNVTGLPAPFEVQRPFIASTCRPSLDLRSAQKKSAIPIRHILLLLRGIDSGGDSGPGLLSDQADWSILFHLAKCPERNSEDQYIWWQNLA